MRLSSFSPILPLLICACGGGGGSDLDGGADLDGSSNGTDAGVSDGAGPQPDADINKGNPIDSTLVSSCGTLQGRAIVNFNGNLGIAFTEDDIPFSSLGSVSFDLPSGFSGSGPNPENWDGESARQVIATTSPGFETFGNHCWFNNPPPPQFGTVVITDWRPNEGIVEASFSNFTIHSCVGAGSCTISGDIRTEGEGVYE